MAQSISSVLYIPESRVRRLLDWELTYKAVEVALEAVSAKRAIQTPRTFTILEEANGVLLSMPGYLKDEQFGALACKLVTSFPNNQRLNEPLPTINAHISLFDESTGVLKAVISATEITAYRTAAASAVATKHLDRGGITPKNSNNKSLALLGAGIQGQSHAKGLQALFNFQRVNIWNRTQQRAQKLAEDLKSSYPSTIVTVFDSAEQCVEDADIVVTATYASEPILKFEWLKPGCHINAIGAGLNHHSELDERIYREAAIFVDHFESANKELAGLLNVGIKFAGEIGQLISGEFDLESIGRDTITVFQSLGLAAEDCAVAKMVYDRYTMEEERNQQ